MLSEYALGQLVKQKFDLQAKNLVRKMLLRKTFASLKNRLILNLLGEQVTAANQSKLVIRYFT
jgi:hypothetical protein